MANEKDENERNNKVYKDKNMKSEQKCNEESKKLDSDMQSFWSHLLEIAYELFTKDICDKLSVLKEGITTVLELKPLLFSAITDELKELLFSGITDEIKHPKGLTECCDLSEVFRKDSLIECNVSNESSEEDFEINESENDENQTQEAGRQRQKVGYKEETDITKGRSTQLKKLGSDKKLMLEANNAYNELQTIKNELEKQPALSCQRFGQLMKLSPSLMASFGIEVSRDLIEISKEDQALTEKEWEQKDEKIEQNSDEGQPYPEEKRQVTRPECKSVSLLQSALRSKFRLLLAQKGGQASLVLKVMNPVNECPDLKQLFYILKDLKFSIARETFEEVEKEVQVEKNFVFEIEGDFEEAKKANEKDRSKD